MKNNDKYQYTYKLDIYSYDGEGDVFYYKHYKFFSEKEFSDIIKKIIIDTLKLYPKGIIPYYCYKTLKKRFKNYNSLEKYVLSLKNKELYEKSRSLNLIDFNFIIDENLKKLEFKEYVPEFTASFIKFADCEDLTIEIIEKM